MPIFKIAGVGLIVAMLHSLLKQTGKDEQGQALTLVGFITVMVVVVGLLGTFVTLVQKTFGFW